MRYIDELKAFLAFDVGKAERKLWKEEDIQDVFREEFATKNIGSALSLLPLACFLAIVLIVAGYIGISFGGEEASSLLMIVYAVLFLMSAVFYFVLRILAKDIKKNSKKILTTLYVMAALYMLWVSALADISGNAQMIIIVYAATITVVTQALYLNPVYSTAYVISSMVLFSVKSLFSSFEQLNYDVSIGIIVLSLISCLVSYTRYQNRCKAIYNKKIIICQNEQLGIFVKELQEKKTELENLNKQLENAYISDRLTGLYNRWYWDETIADPSKKIFESDKPCAIMMLDLDNFKNINDTLGHAMGDKCLVKTAEVLKAATKDMENCDVFRMGGEEFVVWCRAIEKPEAVKLANTVLKDISNIKIEGLNTMLTASIGLHIQKAESERDIEHFLVEADKAMYESKNSGKNRITISLP
ncbi:MAG: GGDEF domain-containing protein [Candidatus Fimenecus sp.]